MNFGFTEEQELLRSEVRKWLDENCPLSELRRITEAAGGPGFSRDHWKAIGELGWLGLTVPEAYGGAGLSWVDLVVVLEESGRTLFPSPLVSHVVAATAIREGGSEAQRARWLPRLAEGSAIATLAAQPGEAPLASEPSGGGVLLRGEKLFVPDAAAATLYLVPCRAGLALVERDGGGVSAHDHPGIDLSKRVGKLVLEGAPGELLERGSLERALDLATAAVTAEAVGAAEAAVALCADYARERLQFGSPIGRYQAVKHPLAEMHVDVESWKSLTYYAAWCIEESPLEAARYVSMAKAYASEAFARIGIDVVQLHGAVGYTWEHDPHLYLKRSKWVRAMYGDADWHYDRVASLADAGEGRGEPPTRGGE